MQKTVLVTGISGFIGLHCAKKLLESGFQVRGTVRSEEKEEIVRDALALSAEKASHLSFKVLNLKLDDGWNEATRGCDYVMHIASPFRIANPKDEIEMIEPAVEGTKRVLRAGYLANVKRIVLTSSIVAMMASLRQGQFGPDDWTDITYPNLNTYIKSKTQAEKAAWDFINSQNTSDSTKVVGPELVVIAPGGVFGPPLGRDISGESLTVLTKMLNGKIPMVPETAFPMVDVRDVAELHLRAMLHSEAAGHRFIVAGTKPFSFADVAEILIKAGYKGPSKKRAPDWLFRFLALFDREAAGMVGLLGMRPSADNSKTREMFDWTPMPFEQSVLDSARAIKSFKTN